MRYTAIIFVLVANVASGDSQTNGPDGIDSKSTELTGVGIEIGQVEPGGRSGKGGFDDTANSASNTIPAKVYFQTSEVNTPNDHIQEHTTLVAGVMIGKDTTGALYEGVAPQAYLHSGGFSGGPNDVDLALALQRIATVSGTDAGGGPVRMRAINLSFIRGLDGILEKPDGYTHSSMFIDWSSRRHDVLYVTAWGNDDNPELRTPGDNYNGITIAASEYVDIVEDPVYRRFAGVNATEGDATGDRTSIDLMAPGQAVAIRGHGNIAMVRNGSSAATPHVTGAVGLLQQHAEPKVIAGTDPRWGENSQKHETMKAIMLNSADKLSGVHGSNRTVLDRNGNDWTLSPAFGSSEIPLDRWMGAGHLNVRRAVQQYTPGEYDPGTVQSIGWDYQGVGDRNEYVFDSEIGGGYIAATLVWDRRVDKVMPGNYTAGDTFVIQPITQQLNNLDLYLMPAASNDLMDAIAVSNSTAENVEHIFFNIPSADQYKLVVHNNPSDGIGDFQNYALAWWFGNAPSPPGDYNGNGSVGPEDYNAWRMNFGASVATGTGADGNGNGIIDAADYVVWRNNLSAGVGSVATIPEPSTASLGISLIFALKHRRVVLASLRPIT